MKGDQVPTLESVLQVGNEHNVLINEWVLLCIFFLFLRNFYDRERFSKQYPCSMLECLTKGVQHRIFEGYN